MTDLAIPCAGSSLRDEVTGLYNRGHLLLRLKENMARCLRNKEPMAIVLWDIDGFIDFNNQYGQAEGDQLLKKVADVIRKSVRIYDEAFRFGPDEFCALLLPCDEKTANEVTGRVKNAVSRDLFEGNSAYAQHSFSISFGTTFYTGPASPDQLPEALLHAASQALYRSHLSRP